MAIYRDIKLKQQKRLEQKQDRRNQFRAVIVDALGNQSGAGSIWADQNTRRVWVMPIGGGQPFQIICVRITPVIGLGVICGYADAFSNQIEVLRTDYEFLGPSNTTGTAYESPSNLDFLPGGRLQLWLDGRLIQPLATYPDTSGLTVNVVAGEYIYDNTRKTFAGETGLDLTASVPGTPGDYRYVGLYLDSNNSLQTVDGATSASTSPAEPTWPDGAFQLSMVRLTNGQTSISIADDVVNKRIFSSDVISFSGWPFANVYSVSTDAAADFSTVALAAAAASSGDVFLFDAGTFTCDGVTFPDGVTLIGMGDATVLSTSSNADCLIATQAINICNLKLQNTYINNSGTIYAFRQDSNPGDAVLVNVTLAATNAGTLSTANGAVIYQGRLIDCFAIASGTSTGRGVYGTTMDVYGGRYSGSTADVAIGASAVGRLYGPVLVNSTTSIGGSSTLYGQYYDTTGNLITLPGAGMSAGVWLLDESAGLRIKYATIADAISAAASGDTVLIYPDTYDQSTTVLTIDKAITLLGTDPKNCIITGSASNNTTINVTVDNVRIENITINHTGTGTGGVAVRWATNNLIIQNCYLNTTGAASGNYVYDHQGGNTTKSQIINCYGISTGATSNSGYVNTSAAAKCDIIGGSISGATYDIYGDQSGSTLLLNEPVLTSGIVDWAGTKRGEALDSYGRRLRFKPVGVSNGRLTLTSGTPVTTGDVTAATTIYYTPYIGGKCEVFNGYVWIEAPFTELSLSLSGFTADKNSDVWIYDNAGTLALERTEWTNDTARATAIAYQDGRYVKSGATTRLYLGTFRTTGTTGQTEDSIANRYVWNYYNRRKRELYRENGSSHTYVTGSWRPWNNSQTNSQVQCVIGVLEERYPVMLWAQCIVASGNAQPFVAVGMNTTSGQTTQAITHTAVSMWRQGISQPLLPQLGYNYFCLVEFGGSTAPTFSTAGVGVDLTG